MGAAGTKREPQGALVVEPRPLANPSTDPLHEVLTLMICDLFASEFWCQTMRPLAEKIAAEIIRRFQIVPKDRA